MENAQAKRIVEGLLQIIAHSGAAEVLKRGDGSLVIPRVEISEDIDPGARAHFSKTDDRVGCITIRPSSVEEAVMSENNFILMLSIVHEWVHATQASNPKLDGLYAKDLDPQRDVQGSVLIEADAVVRAAWAAEQLRRENKISPIPQDTNETGAKLQKIYEQSVELKKEGSHESGAACEPLFRTFLFAADGQIAGGYVRKSLAETNELLSTLEHLIATKDVKKITLTGGNWMVSEQPYPAEALEALGKVGKVNYMADDEGKTEWVSAPDFTHYLIKKPDRTDFDQRMKSFKARAEKIRPLLVGRTPDEKSNNDRLADEEWRKKITQKPITSGQVTSRNSQSGGIA